jgi:membrane-associated protease RseP (regulator of RpoE activity)
MNRIEQGIKMGMVVSSAILLSACASSPSATSKRGWIGGEMLQAKASWFSDLKNAAEVSTIPVLPAAVRDRQTRAVYVEAVYPETPIERAGIRAGDLIVACNGEQVKSLNDLYAMVQRLTPGAKATILIYRDTDWLELPVTVGRETVRQVGLVSAGLALSPTLDLIPNPDFNLLSLIRFEKRDARVDLHAPKAVYLQKNNAATETTPEGEQGLRSHGWDAWFLLCGFGAHEVILDQTIVE